MFYVYVGITKNKDNANKIINYYKELGYDTILKEFYINNICKSKISGEADEEMKNFSLDDSDATLEKNISIVYSGGDDVFVVGTWLDVLNFAFDLRECFKKYTCNKFWWYWG